MGSPNTFNSNQIAEKWYAYWLANQYFHSEPDSRKPYTIVIPPPNVTGVLHMGHMMNNTLQDVLIRRARMLGMNACWVPGTDHASIATEAKVVQKLADQGVKKEDLTREEFLKHAWEWTDEHGGIILEQLKKLGCSCDWDRTKFTLDEPMTESVLRVFVDLFHRGLIYRGFRMVNWDPEAQTTLSDEEVIYEEKQGNLYHIAYRVVDSEETVTIATTRPETLMGDTAVAVHPEDERFTHLHGKKVVVPIVNREVPIITDSYVDMEFGTGCLKVTPAHDENDKALGDKHKLGFVDIFNPDGTLNAEGLHFEGKDRFEVRKLIVQQLKSSKMLLQTKPHTHKVGLSERTKAVVEPKLSDQWFLKMEDLAKPALTAVENGTVQLFPKKFMNSYRHWMNNIRDWNISRQLWWGQQIPAYFYGTGKQDFVVALTPEEALEKAREKTKNPSLNAADLTQDSDVLDTWFSSWLWPISVFDGIRFPENDEIQYYYPTQDLVTGPDILFFWVARMIMSGYTFRNQQPFQNVYLTGLVRDSQGRKMSKQLGNSPDALGLIEKYGADSVRVGLLLSSAAGNDLLFDEALCQQGKNFANKIWNAHRLIQSWDIDDSIPQDQTAKQSLEWYKSKFQNELTLVNDHFTKYRISDALMCIYKLVWDDFCSWLLELIKPAYGSPIDAQTHAEVIQIFENNLRLLHPFMPFLSEELWHDIAKRTKTEALVVSSWPTETKIDKAVLSIFSHTMEMVTSIRAIRKQKNISMKVPMQLLETSSQMDYYKAVISKLANVETCELVNDLPDQVLSFRVGTAVYYLPFSVENPEEELAKLNQDLNYQKVFLAGVQKKLSNTRFVDHAPTQVVEIERKKEKDALEKIKHIEHQIAQLQG
ncbi:MAG: valine--tRNA ligase [Flavobacteriaceae bacterium]|nr:valine--tRNA ligase [Flavobacteriaceae bacterium]